MSNTANDFFSPNEQVLKDYLNAIKVVTNVIKYLKRSKQAAKELKYIELKINSMRNDISYWRRAAVKIKSSKTKNELYNLINESKRELRILEKKKAKLESEISNIELQIDNYQDYTDFVANIYPKAYFSDIKIESLNKEELIAHLLIYIRSPISPLTKVTFKLEDPFLDGDERKEIVKHFNEWNHNNFADWIAET